MRRTRAHDEARARNHELARLVAFAVNDPKKMPDFEPTDTGDKPEVSTVADDLSVRGYFIGLALKGN